jgi:hypothetical protein
MLTKSHTAASNTELFESIFEVSKFANLNLVVKSTKKINNIMFLISY